MLQANAPPPVFRQMEQKQYMNGTGVSESTVKVILPHWQEPDRARGPLVLDGDFDRGLVLVFVLVLVLVSALALGIAEYWPLLAIW